MAGPHPAIPLPELTQAGLSTEVLDQLFSDIAAFAIVHRVVARSRSLDRGQQALSSLEEGREGLLGGHFQALQIRYRHGGQDWCDTLLRSPSGFRIVRMNESEADALHQSPAVTHDTGARETCS